jgi:hypothetical protein
MSIRGDATDQRCSNNLSIRKLFELASSRPYLLDRCSGVQVWWSFARPGEAELSALINESLTLYFLAAGNRLKPRLVNYRYFPIINRDNLQIDHLPQIARHRLIDRTQHVGEIALAHR